MATIESLQKENKELKKEIEELRNKNARLEKFASERIDMMINLRKKYNALIKAPWWKRIFITEW